KRSERASTVQRPARTGDEPSRHSTRSAPSPSAPTRADASPRRCCPRAPRGDPAANPCEGVDLVAGAPRSPIRALAEQAARRARIRLADRRSDGATKPAGQNRFGLTEREADVFCLLADARTNREIG